MDYVDILKLLGVLLLVAGNAFFVGSEIALTSARRSRIQQLADIGNRNAKIVQILHNEPERFYSVIPARTDQNRCAQSRIPMDMIFQGRSIRLFQASQHRATISS